MLNKGRGQISSPPVLVFVDRGLSSAPWPRRNAPPGSHWSFIHPGGLRGTIRDRPRRCELASHAAPRPRRRCRRCVPTGRGPEPRRAAAVGTLPWWRKAIRPAARLRRGSAGPATGLAVRTSRVHRRSSADQGSRSDRCSPPAKPGSWTSVRLQRTLIAGGPPLPEDQ
jgi:hypothetical protein